MDAVTPDELVEVEVDLQAMEPAARLIVDWSAKNGGTVYNGFVLLCFAVLIYTRAMKVPDDRGPDMIRQLADHVGENAEGGK